MVIPARQNARPPFGGAGLGLLVLLAALGLTALSQPSAQSPQPRRPGPASALPSGGAAPMPEQQLLERLAVADQQWWPRREPLPNGGTRYHYRKRPGDPDLSLAQIKALIANPPRFDRERQVVRELWRRLDGLGVRLSLEQPRKPGAAGEWDPAARTLRILPTVIGKGSAEFARVLNHEAIHVAQSCSGGGIGASPRPLGLPDQLPPALQSVLQQPTYARADRRERLLEREAYANQDQLELGLSLLGRHC